MASEPAAAHQLTYGTQPPSYRRWLRLFGVLTVIALVLGSVWFAKDRAHHWYTKYQYGRVADRWYPLVCTGVENPPLLKFTEDPADAPGGFVSSMNGRGFAVLHQDPFLDRLPMFTGGGDPILSSLWCIVFRHERATAQVKSLLMVDMSPGAGTTIWLSTWMIGRSTAGPIAGMIGNVSGRGKSIDLKNAVVPGSLRLFSGQIDPVDSARFWIPFESKGHSGKIVGVLTPGMTFSKDPQAARLEAEINTSVQWTVMLDSPATSQAVKPGGL
jgi:hypothetical protein